jgi:hypothetical protein
MTAERMAAWPPETLSVVYWATLQGSRPGWPLRLSELAHRVKLMPGGMMGWADEGFAFAHRAESGAVVQSSAA